MRVFSLQPETPLRLCGRPLSTLCFDDTSRRASGKSQVPDLKMFLPAHIHVSQRWSSAAVFNWSYLHIPASLICGSSTAELLVQVDQLPTMWPAPPPNIWSRDCETDLTSSPDKSFALVRTADTHPSGFQQQRKKLPTRLCAKDQPRPQKPS